MNNETLKASVQYGDYHGTVAADRHDQRDLDDVAKKYGIDTERYFVFGVELYIGETHSDALEEPYVSILAVDTQVVPAYGVDPINRWVQSHDGFLPCVRFNVDADLEEVLLSFKRFKFVLTNTYLTPTNGCRVTEDEP